MRNPALRIYIEPDVEVDEAHAATTEPLRSVNMPLGELAAVLLDALRTNRRWVYDFQDEPVTISEDLYEILLAYRRFRPAVGDH